MELWYGLAERHKKLQFGKQVPTSIRSSEKFWFPKCMPFGALILSEESLKDKNLTFRIRRDRETWNLTCLVRYCVLKKYQLPCGWTGCTIFRDNGSKKGIFALLQIGPKRMKLGMHMRDVILTSQNISPLLILLWISSGHDFHGTLSWDICTQSRG